MANVGAPSIGFVPMFGATGGGDCRAPASADCFGATYAVLCGLPRLRAVSFDIAHNEKELLFTGSFTTAGLRAEVGGGGLRISTEGKVRKLVKRVDQITYSVARVSPSAVRNRP